MLIVLTLAGCKKEEYSFGKIVTPKELSVTTAIQGLNVANPEGDGSGKVTITATATGALNYKIDFGDGTTQLVPTGTYTYKYNSPGTSEYVISVTAIGTGGATSTLSKKVKVFVAFTIPSNIVDALAGASSKVWVTDKDAVGHFGVGPNDQFAAIWYEATPNTREACAYDDEITFSKDAANNIYMNVNNKGESFSLAASSAFYGFAGGDGCYAINPGGNKKLVFMDATTASSPSVSTRIQFMVPGNGIINFGTGGTVYEILSISANTIHLRNIGTDGNAWYQKLKVKP